MAKYDLFVGRAEELKRVNQWIKQKEKGSILIAGDGGIGKTFLLQKIARDYQDKDHFDVEYFDLAEQPPDIISQAYHLANTLGIQHFSEFNEQVEKMARGEYDLSVVNQEELQEKAINTCIKELKDYLTKTGNTLIRITDTIEIALAYNFQDQVFNERIKDIPNIILISAGRKPDEVRKKFEQIFTKSGLLYIPLHGFENEESEKYFEEIDAKKRIPKPMREKLHLLTNGRPVLLSLAVEYLNQHVPLPEIANSEYEDLKSQFNEDRQKLTDKFEFELVSKIRELQSPKDKAVLFMAQINRRMNAEILSILLDINEKKGEEILSSLLDFAFVKEFIGSIPTKCTLHDEMIELVKKHAWPYFDNTGEEQKRLARKVIDNFYEKHIRKLEQDRIARLQQRGEKSIWPIPYEGEWEQWLLEAECLYYKFQLGRIAGIDYFDQTFYDALVNNHIIRMQFLINEMEKAGYPESAQLRRAEILRRLGHFDEARKICTAALENAGLSISDQISAHTTIGYIDSEVAKPTDAQKHFLKALSLGEGIGDTNSQAIMHNNLGRFYRQISKLDRAVEHLRQALDLAIKSGNLRQAASTRNNLAATLRIIGELDEANAMCRAAIAELKKLGQNTPLAYAYLTKADIDRDKGSPRNAERAAKQALTMFKEVNEIAGQAQAYRTLASIERLLQRFDNAKSYLQQAINLIEGKEGVKPILASLYQVYGRTYRHHATYLQDFPNAENEGQEKELLQEALTYLDKSIELGNEIGNLWEVARSQLEIVLIKMLSQESLATNELNANLNEVEEIALQIEDNLLLGYVYENRGRIALRKGNYRAAGRAFGEAAQFIVQCKGQEGDRAIDRLYDILLDSDLENEQSDALAEGILERLDKKSISTYKALKGLETMCKQILGVATI